MNDILFCGSILPTKLISDHVAFAQEVESVGGDLVFVADENPFPPYRDIWGVLHSIATNTNRIKLGTAIIPILARHPAHVAVQLSSLAEITGENRTVLGIGVGGDWTLSPIGIETKGTNYVGVMREATKIFRTLFSGRLIDTTRDRLRYFIMHNLHLAPYPKNPPKIYFGVRSPKLLQLTGQVADGLLNTIPIGLVPKTLGLIKKGAEKVGRDIKKIGFYNRLGIVVGKNSQKTIDCARKTMIHFFRRPYNPDFDSLDIPIEDVEGLQKAMKKDINSAFKHVTDSMVNQCSIYGTPDEVIEKIAAVHKIGINHFALTDVWGPDETYAKKMIKEKIIP
ncbi:MAG: LLM class flavin-dependent oxidoreductase, partial [Candidatus Ranarchaeia archaeon]